MHTRRKQKSHNHVQAVYALPYRAWAVKVARDGIYSRLRLQPQHLQEDALWLGRHPEHGLRRRQQTRKRLW